jgi:hypothetical protein
MAAMASLIGVVWPAIVGAAVAGILIYLSLRGVAGSHTDVARLKWPAEVDGSTGQEAGAPSQRLG